jgi:hypothetical protein
MSFDFGKRSIDIIGPDVEEQAIGFVLDHTTICGFMGADESTTGSTFSLELRIIESWIGLDVPVKDIAIELSGSQSIVRRNFDVDKGM